jgi:hypothetical protein
VCRCLAARADLVLSRVGKLNLSWPDDEETGRDDGRFAEVDLGLAYRPASNDPLNMLGKYTYLHDLDSSGQSDAASDTDERSHVMSIEGIPDLSRRWLKTSPVSATT